MHWKNVHESSSQRVAWLRLEDVQPTPPLGVVARIQRVSTCWTNTTSPGSHCDHVCWLVQAPTYMVYRQLPAMQSVEHQKVGNTSQQLEGTSAREVRLPTHEQTTLPYRTPSLLVEKTRTVARLFARATNVATTATQQLRHHHHLHDIPHHAGRCSRIGASGTELSHQQHRHHLLHVEATTAVVTITQHPHGHHRHEHALHLAQLILTTRQHVHEAAEDHHTRVEAEHLHFGRSPIRASAVLFHQLERLFVLFHHPTQHFVALTGKDHVTEGDCFDGHRLCEGRDGHAEVVEGVDRHLSVSCCVVDDLSQINRTDTVLGLEPNTTRHHVPNDVVDGAKQAIHEICAEIESGFAGGHGVIPLECESSLTTSLLSVTPLYHSFCDVQRKTRPQNMKERRSALSLCGVDSDAVDCDRLPNVC